MSTREPTDILTLTERGLYCAAGSFFIDPWPRADEPARLSIVTHGHADHARPNSQRYIATAPTAAVMHTRMGADLDITTWPYESQYQLGDATVSLHPAGHVLGSAQVRVEVSGQVWVVSGDYKRDPDPTCVPFQVVPCDVFITEATFALPAYRWRPAAEVVASIAEWWAQNAAKGKTSVLFCYSFGKVQRILAELSQLTADTVYLHGAMQRLVALYRDFDVVMVPTRLVGDAGKDTDFSKALIVAPPAAAGSPWMRRFKNHSTGFVSGWMRVRGNRRRRGYDRGFVISDHADWPSLLATIRDTGARRVLATHGKTDILVRYLQEQGMDAQALQTRFDGSGEEAAEHPDQQRAVSDSGGAGSHRVKAFTELYRALDQTNATNAKIEAMVDYFATVPAADAAWAVYFLSGRRLKRLIKRAELRSWILSATGQPEWLLEETYRHVGDMAETIALLLPEPDTSALDDFPLSRWVEERLIPLSAVAPESRAERVQRWWRTLPDAARFTLNKLLTGALRVGVSQRLVIRALAAHFGLESAVIAHRLMGEWRPGADWFVELGNPDTRRVSVSTPYPFYLASSLATEPAQLGARAAWQVEWKWDGIRAQLIHRQGQVFIWSRGEELLTDRFPEITQATSTLPHDCVLDGELLAWSGGGPLPFAALQRRIGKLKPGATLLRDVPVVFLAYDLLEYQGRDARSEPLVARRERLVDMLIADAYPLCLSPEVRENSWDALKALREESRARGVEGLMLKDRDSRYGVGRARGGWWKWKIDPLTIDAALIYAQPGSGRRSNLFTDYTFAVWQGEPNASNLVPVCKAYSGLDNEEITELDRWIRQHTRERFGPVRSVDPHHVFEIAFEGIAPSSRHKSGVALRFPRISRWRRDLSLADVDTLSSVSELIERANPDPAIAARAR